LSHHTPKEAVQALKDQIWTKIIERDELEAYEEKFNIISSNFNQDNTLNIRVHSMEQPNETFQAKAPDLADVYFVTLREQKEVVAA
jgi:hypothetical protein